MGRASAEGMDRAVRTSAHGVQPMWYMEGMDIAVRGVLMNCHCPKQTVDGMDGTRQSEAKWDLTVVTPKLEPLNNAPLLFLDGSTSFFLFPLEAKKRWGHGSPIQYPTVACCLIKIDLCSGMWRASSQLCWVTCGCNSRWSPRAELCFPRPAECSCPHTPQCPLQQTGDNGGGGAEGQRGC